MDGPSGGLRECALAVARVLVQRGARLDGLVQSPQPIESAAQGGDLDLVKQLAAAGCALSGALDRAAGCGHVHVVAWLVEVAGVDVDEAAPGGATPLMSAAESGEIETVRELLRLGADPTRRVGGHSIAEIAEGMDHLDLARELRDGVPAEPRRWMKWFGSRWHRTDLTLEETQAIRADYKRHLQGLLPSLPGDLHALSEAGGLLSLHDAHVLLLDSDAATRRVVVDLETDDYFEEEPRGRVKHATLRVRIVYVGAEIVVPLRPARHRYRTRAADVIDGELDVSDDGRFEHRIQFAASHPTLVVRFSDATMQIIRFANDQARLVEPTELRR